MEIAMGILYLIAVCAFLGSGLTLTAHVLGGWLGRYGAKRDEGTVPQEVVDGRRYRFGMNPFGGFRRASRRPM